MNSEAKNFEAISKAIQAHNSECPAQPTAVCMSYYDIERMGWEEGDVICGLPLSAGAQAGRIQILCDAQGDGGKDEQEEEEIVNAVSNDNRLVTV